MNGRLAHNLEDKSRTDDVLVVQDVVFSSLLLPDFILRGLESAGFKKPSPIQLSAIPLARCGLDLIVQAKSGTGKTLVFTVTLLEAVKVKLKRLQVIILAPTREIAIQIADVIKSVGRFLKGLKIGTFIGGMPIEDDKHALSGCQIAVGAPGRVRHLIEQGIMDSSAVRLLVLDEADKLMEEIFIKDINYIFNKCCSSKQTVACSATYTPELLDFVKQYMKSGRHVVPEGSVVPVLLGLRLFVCITGDHANNYARLKMKQDALFQLLESVRFDQALVFTNYITRAESLCSLLVNRGWAAACLTGKQCQELRNETVERLKEHRAKIVVATDLASRGLDASTINLVINLDIPFSGATYLHRMGRAGRYGSQGICITIVSEGPDCRRFCNILGEIGGKSMNVNVIPQGSKPDLWTINIDNLSKLHGTVEESEEQHLPLNEKQDPLALESNSSPFGSETGSIINASSELDTNCDTTGGHIRKQSINKRTTKIGNRDRKFSNSMREQIEGPESSDYEQNQQQNQIESKHTLSFPYTNDTGKTFSSGTSQNSYNSSKNDEEEGNAVLPSSNIASSVEDSDDIGLIEEDMERLSLLDSAPLNSYNNYNYNIQNNHNYMNPYYYQYQYNPHYNCAAIPEDDWYIRIEMQIQNFVQYTHNLQLNS